LTKKEIEDEFSQQKMGYLDRERKKIFTMFKWGVKDLSVLLKECYQAKYNEDMTKRLLSLLTRMTLLTKELENPESVSFTTWVKILESVNNYSSFITSAVDFASEITLEGFSIVFFEFFLPIKLEIEGVFYS